MRSRTPSSRRNSQSPNPEFSCSYATPSTHCFAHSQESGVVWSGGRTRHWSQRRSAGARPVPVEPETRTYALLWLRFQSFVGEKENKKKLNKCVLPNARTDSEMNGTALWASRKDCCCTGFILSSFSATVVAMIKDTNVVGVIVHVVYGSRTQPLIIKV
jgi:hypothetical protein